MHDTMGGSDSYVSSTSIELRDKRNNRKSGGKCSAGRVKNCLRTFLAHLFSHIGLCVLIVGYTIAGAVLFEHLESKNEIQERQSRSKNWTKRFSQVRQNYIGELWNITEKFNVLYEKNWTTAVDKELKNFEAVVASAAKLEGHEIGWEAERKWSFSGALLYSVSIITTIGYGHIAPRTMVGKILTMFYALIGIPLMLLWLSNIGTLMAKTFKFVYFHLCCIRRRRKSVQNNKTPKLQSSHNNMNSIGNSGHSGSKSTSPSPSQNHKPQTPSHVTQTQIRYSPSVLQGGKCEILFDSNHQNNQNNYGSYNNSTNSIGPHHTSSTLGRTSNSIIKNRNNSSGSVSVRDLRALNSDARQVLYECAQYNCLQSTQSPSGSGSDTDVERSSRKILHQLRSNSYVIDECDECNEDIDIDEVHLAPNNIDIIDMVHPQCTCGIDVVTIPYGRKHHQNYSTPSKIPLLQSGSHTEGGPVEYDGSVGHLSGPDLVELDNFDVCDNVDCDLARNLDNLEDVEGTMQGYGGDEEPRVPVCLVLVFLVFYIMVGAFVFSVWEEWNFIESSYFCFITLTTIGLGDYVPGRSLSTAGSEEGTAQLVVCCLYLVLGLAIIAMSFNLVQEEVAAKVKEVARNIGIITREPEG